MSLPNLLAFLLAIAVQVQAPALAPAADPAPKAPPAKAAPAAPAAGQVVVPSVIGLKWHVAEAKLFQAGFKPQFQAGSTDAEVTHQEPRQGTTANPGSIVFVQAVEQKQQQPAAAGIPQILPLPDGVYILPDNAQIATIRVLIIGQGPVPPPVPVPNDLTERAKAVKAAAEKSTADPKRDETAAGIAKVYRTLADAAASDPTVTPKALANAVSIGTGQVVGRQGQSADAIAAWKPLRDLIGGDVYGTGKLQEDGAPLAEYVKLYREAADGLDASVVKKAIDPAFWKWLIETILPLILELLKK